jgi:uncharacterized protein (TIGR02118 family)
MTVRLLVLYGQPADPSAFDAYYASKHVPLAKKLPGLRAYTINKGEIGSPAGRPDTYLVAELDFASMADFQNAVSSPEGAAATGDVPNFATGGATMMWYEVADA